MHDHITSPHPNAHVLLRRALLFLFDTRPTRLVITYIRTYLSKLPNVSAMLFSSDII